jgi:hypothetical protein
LHFHHYLLAGMKRGCVHLGDGRGGERLPVELQEDILEGPAELLLHDPANCLEGLRWDPVAEETELVDELSREDAFTRREDLAQLDVRGSEGLKSQAQPARETSPRQLGTRRPAALAPLDQVPAADCLDELGSDPDHSTARRQPALAEQVGDLAGGGGPQLVDTGPPLQPIYVNNPGRLCAEGSD